MPGQRRGLFTRHGLSRRLAALLVPLFAWAGLWPGAIPARAQAPAATIQSVQFSPASLLASQFPATWTVSVTVAADVYASDTFTLTGPPLAQGFEWSAQPGDYSATVTDGSTTTAQAVYFPQGGPYEENTVTLSLGSGTAPVAVAGDVVTLTVTGSVNPEAGTYPAGDFSVQFDAQTPVSPLQGIEFFDALTTTSVTVDDLIAGATADWTLAFTSPTALAAGSGTLTLTGPMGLPTSPADYTIQDTTAGGPAAAPTAVTPVSGGVQLTVPAGVASGDGVLLQVSGVTNPALNLLDAGQLFPGSAQIVVSGSTVPIYVAFGGTFVAGQPDVTASVSSTVSGAPGVTWTFGFPAEAVLGAGATITVGESLGGAAFASDPADYGISVNGGAPVTPAAVTATQAGAGGAQATLTLPAGTTIPILAQVSVQARAVSNPTATGAVQATVSTSRTPAGSVVPALTFSAPVSSLGSGTSTSSGGVQSGQVHLAQTAMPLPPEPLQPLSSTPNSPATLVFGAMCNSTGTCGGSLTLLAQSQTVDNTVIYIDPSRSVTLPVWNSTNGGNSFSNTSNITVQSVCASAPVNGTPTQLGCISNLTPGQTQNLVFTLPGVASSVTLTATASGVSNSPVEAMPAGVNQSPGPMEIVQSPTVMEELNALPFKILYQPPGDQSSSQYTLSQGSSAEADYSLTSSESNTQTSSMDLSLSVDAGIQAGGFSADVNNNAEWDQTATNTATNSVTTDRGVTYTTTNTQTWTAGPDAALDTPGTQPWTGDQFVLLVHPQFAVWDNLTCSNGTSTIPPSPQGGCPSGSQSQGQVAYALAGSNPNFLTVNAAQLLTCAQGTPLVPPGTYVPPVELTPAECLSLLRLDPFAQTASQGVNPSALSSLGQLATPVESYSASSSTTSTQITLDSQTATTISTTAESSFSSEVDSLFTDSAAVTVGYSGGIGDLATGNTSAGITYTASSGSDVSQTVDVQQSQTSTSTIEQAASATLGDASHALATTIYLDSRWDTLMFQVATPVVSSVSPSSGSAGMTVAIAGSGFTSGPMTVQFCPTAGGGACVPAANPSASSSDAASATVPTDLQPGTYLVQVLTSGGPSVPVCSSGSSCADFTVLPSIGASGASVASLNPSTGPDGGGTTVTITGSGLTGTTAVWFGVSDPTQDPGDLQQFQQSGAAGPPPVAPAPAFRIVSDSEIIACAPAVSATGTLWVSVLGPDGWSPVTPGDAFSYTAGAAAATCNQNTLVGPPAVSSLTPATGPAQGGTTITVNGANFQNLLVTAPCDTAGCPPGGTVTLIEPPPVDFCALGGSPCVPGTDVNLVSASQLTVQVPPGSGTVDVLVGGPVGFSQPVAADEYTYTAGTACSNCPGPGSLGLAVVPGQVAAGPGEATVLATVLNTEDLPVPNAPVQFSAAGGQFSVTGAVYTDAAGVAEDTLTTGAPGAVSINAVVPGAPELENQTQAQFLPLPVVTGLSTASGPMAGGNSVTVEGVGFTGATSVDFGGTAVPVTPAQVNAAGTAIVVTAPPGGGTVDVRVANPAAISGTGAADQYTYVTGSLLAPQVTGLSPASGPTAGGTLVTISGSGFTGASAVYFGSVPVAAGGFQVVSDGQITATAPPGTGTVAVTVTTQYGTSALTPADQFTYTTPLQPVTRTLSAGWNTLSVPFPLAATSLAQVLSDGGASLEVGFAYQNGAWVQLTSANEAQLLSQPMTGLFLDLAPGASVTATLTPATTPNPPPTLTLQQGWNLVGPSSISGPLSYATFLNGVTPSAVPELVDPNGTPAATTDPAANTTGQVRDGYAYWLYASAPGQVLLGQAATGTTNP